MSRGDTTSPTCSEVVAVGLRRGESVRPGAVDASPASAAVFDGFGRLSITGCDGPEVGSDALTGFLGFATSRSASETWSALLVFPFPCADEEGAALEPPVLPPRRDEFRFTPDGTEDGGADVGRTSDGGGRKKRRSYASRYFL